MSGKEPCSVPGAGMDKCCAMSAWRGLCPEDTLQPGQECIWKIYPARERD